MIDCDNRGNDHGCHGGLMNNAYPFLNRYGFAKTENYGDHEYHNV